MAIDCVSVFTLTRELRCPLVKSNRAPRYSYPWQLIVRVSVFKLNGICEQSTGFHMSVTHPNRLSLPSVSFKISTLRADSKCHCLFS